MNVTFFAGVTKEREHEIARMLGQGVQSHGDTFELVDPAEYPAPNKETDVAVMVGVKGYSRKLFDDHLAVGKQVIYIDKGYLGHRGRYYRMSVNSFQPLSYFQSIPRLSDRLKTHNIKLQPMRKNGSHIMIAGGSVKYANWHGLNAMGGEDPMTVWARKRILRLRKHSRRPLVYRPKPSWKDAVLVSGARFSRPPRTITQELIDCWALITFGSNAAVDALIAGVPVVVLGDGVALPLAQTSEEKIEDLYIPTDNERQQWLQDLAYCQFNLTEMASGEAWGILKEQIV